MRANGAKIEKVQVKRISVLTSDTSAPEDTDLINSDGPVRLEDVKDQCTLARPLLVDKELVLCHYASLRSQVA